MKVGSQYLGNNVCEFTLWSPLKEKVAVHLVSPEEKLLTMTKQEQGYWYLKAENIDPGTLYYYQLEDSVDRPDPASHFQPQGVHEASAVIDHNNTSWQDSQWTGIPLEEMIIYELHVGTFTPEGTFKAIIPRLSDLVELGVNTIELMPIAQFPGDRNWGYDGVYSYAVQNSYGRPEDLKQLVDEAHQQGIAVILDVVYNHFGPEGNYMAHYAPYFTHTYQTPWGDAINFDNAYSDGVRNYFSENVLYWLEIYHIDGLRLDAIQAIYDAGAKHILQEMAEKVEEFSHQVGKKFYLIAESDRNDVRIIRPRELGGYGLDAQWSDDFHHSLRTVLTKESGGYYVDFGTCQQLAKAYQNTFVYDWQYSQFRKRYHGNVIGDRPAWQFVVCIQNHDQIGNRMLGERLSDLIDFEAVKLAAGALLLSPYIPLLFMGQEYGEESPFLYFVSHEDPDLVAAVREGRKQEFTDFHLEGEYIDPQSTQAFNLSKINWQQKNEEKHQVLWQFYQQLINLRKTIPALKKLDKQNLQVTAEESDRLITLHRWQNDSQIFSIFNFNDQNVELKNVVLRGKWQKILDSSETKWMGSGSNLPEKIETKEQQLSIKPHSFVVYQQ
ncbi:malto-oligosyltrehalose trehalohydrolase [Pleurocapsa sp. CCALA 161]|uniref:malto-oligosyltrehalose trehalohydrolase n=1 Tax=Pleurocapsa sp. CCALA 161 TaxID=2107688 RepID=UPI000D079763|nr:malto-oligosyltrehalose trehalohydrolase [Pleurocapsa sp. CCALA 161]PSB07885.1 malto-oligosyltrehalose trehalohydrolase [Pleurocapsa sp. CCALA 161]